MDREACSTCGGMALIATLKQFSGLCRRCSNSQNRPSIEQRLETLGARLQPPPLSDVVAPEYLAELGGLCVCCPCCGNRTLSNQGWPERCGVCGWLVDSKSALSDTRAPALVKARHCFEEQGVADPDYLGRTRAPRLSEMESTPERIGETEHDDAELRALRERWSAHCESLRTEVVAGQGAHPYLAIDELLLEAGAGESLEDYFRWASPPRLVMITQHLRHLDLFETAAILEQSFISAFGKEWLQVVSDDTRLDAAIESWSPEVCELLAKNYLSLQRLEASILRALLSEGL